jgi:15-cis-phytoene synthase
MPRKEEVRIFKEASRTFYFASKLFPRSAREDIFILYAFVRTVDDFVDCTPQDRNGFESFTDSLWEAQRTGSSPDPIIDRFVDLWVRVGFERSWVDAFLQAMESDFEKHEYRTLKETEHYMYGSAEVIGLMMLRILSVSEKAVPYARSLGRAFQYINMIRDVSEDNALGRRYLPLSEMKRYGLESLDERYVRENEGSFRLFIHAQLAYFERWLHQSRAGFSYLPKRSRMAIETACSLYEWTAQQIKDDPLIIYERKVRPPTHVVVREAARSVL